MTPQNMSILNLVLQASWVVQLVMLLLLSVSIASWAAIFRKLFALKRVKSLNEDFEREFWSGTSLNDLYAAAAQNAKQAGPMERIFASGMREYQKLRERRITDPGTLLDGARRAMRASFQREMDVVESILSILGAVPMAIAAAFVVPLANKFSKQKLTLAGLALGVVGGVIAGLGAIDHREGREAAHEHRQVGAAVAGRAGLELGGCGCG